MEGKKKKFNMMDMMIGFFVGFFFDVIAFIIDFFSFGAGGTLVQGTIWPFLKKFWISPGSSKQENLLKDYLVPIIVQAIPFIPTMAATIPVYMSLENKSDQLGIIKKEGVGIPGAKTGNKEEQKEAQQQVRNRIQQTDENEENSDDEEESSSASYNKPRLLSVPSSPIRANSAQQEEYDA